MSEASNIALQEAVLEQGSGLYAVHFILALILTIFVGSLTMYYRMKMQMKQIEKQMRQETNGMPVKPISELPPWLGDGRIFTDAIKYQRESHTKYGPIFGTYMFGRKMIMLTQPEYIDQVFYANAKKITKFRHETEDYLMGTKSLIMQTGEAHKKMRKEIINYVGLPALSSWFKQFVDIFNEEIESWVEETKDGTFIEVTPRVEKAVWRAMSVVVLGSDCPEDTKEGIRREMTEYGNGFFAIPLQIPGTTYDRAVKAKITLASYIEKEQNRRLSLPDKGKDRKDMLQSLINLIESDDNDEDADSRKKCIAESVVSLIWASLDTTKGTTLFMIDGMIDHAPQWTKVRDEQIEVFGEDGIKSHDVTYQRFEKEAPYAIACYKEIVRYYGAGVIAVRDVIDDIEITSIDGKNKFLIPKGYSLGGALYYNSTNPTSTHFKDPTSFIPERFLEPLEEDKNTKYKSTFAPFGAGERLCPGNPIARQEILIFMALMSKYRWTRKQKVEEWIPTPVPQPVGGLWIRCEGLR